MTQLIPLGSPPGEVDEDDLREPDFAEEHCSMTLADQMEGGPEHAPDPETPHGLAGQD
ncbi:MAG: hypothetical protein JXA67_22085 [Micromonosporaceae bacterium]|nr:hypothetical protein [Micromonosporaceae bacterium]